MIDYDGEVWVDSPSFPDYLEVSSCGRVKIKPSEIIMPNGGIRVYTPVPHLGHKKTYKGYSRYVISCKRGGFSNKKVHHLVAEAFLGPKPFDKAVVMHLDDNPLNNRVENLRWATQKENLNSESYIEHCKSRTGDKNPFRKGLLKRN